jgi:hypothetical protein
VCLSTLISSGGIEWLLDLDQKGSLIECLDSPFQKSEHGGRCDLDLRVVNS